MKRSTLRLKLHRETLRHLETWRLREALGAAANTREDLTTCACTNGCVRTHTCTCAGGQRTVTCTLQDLGCCVP